MRLINADALIRSLEKKHERWKELSAIEDETIDYAHKYAINMIRKAPTASEDWIPCSDRLPKENGEYIVSLEDSVYPWARFFNGKWFMLPNNAIAREFGEYEVIAWMPLPKPYREDGEA